MKLSDRIERIFDHAVTLQQNGRLRSTVYCIGKKIYILNQDQTVLMRFLLRNVDQQKGKKLEFKNPVSFNANDYDSKEVEERDGKICFIQQASGFERVKSCKTPNLSPDEVDKLFKSYNSELSNSIIIHDEIRSLLEEDLSHIEFSCEDEEFKIIQRNIYSGSVSELKQKVEEEGLTSSKQILEDFEPIGLRTNDFMALFSFVDRIKLHFMPGDIIVAESLDPTMPMKVLISKCKYDELGETHGRKK